MTSIADRLIKRVFPENSLPKEQRIFKIEPLEYYDDGDVLISVYNNYINARLTINYFNMLINDGNDVRKNIAAKEQLKYDLLEVIVNNATLSDDDIDRMMQNVIQSFKDNNNAILFIFEHPKDEDKYIEMVCPVDVVIDDFIN